ncbi:hypothetical protein [Streptomyces sp. PsTaAH-124]|uniref:hypothetical protein n=1 Tax=Streptomyces sp. PsTaAH-124 TaxID=1157638 RepID=UPI00035FE844
MARAAELVAPVEYTAELGERYPVDAVAVYELPDGSRDVVIVNSGPNQDGTVDAISGQLNSQMIRVALDELGPLAVLPAMPLAEFTDAWAVVHGRLGHLRPHPPGRRSLA